MPVCDDLWYLSNRAEQRAEQAYHRLTGRYGQFMEFSRTNRVSRQRFRTLANRVCDTGAPFGAHTIVYRPSGELLLARHEGVDMWVVPGGGVHADETFRETAERELREETGVQATYDGLAIVTCVTFECDDYSTWGVLPVFEARAESTTIKVNDPDDEISDARWFDELPADTRDREDLVTWRAERLSA